MKKHLIAVAVAAAVAAPAAMADTTLYGLAHGSIDYIDNDTDSNVNIASNSSRLGVKGSEKISDGLTAVYQYETDINFVEGDLINGGRNSFVGLAGGFGTALIGKHDTPMKLVGRKYDLFGDQVGDSRNLIGSKVGDSSAGFDLRPGNVAAYISPNMGGFQVIGAYVTDHDQLTSLTREAGPLDDNNDFDAFSVSAGYAFQKLFTIDAAYEQHNISDVVATGLGVEDSEDAFRVGAGVTMAGFKVNALYHSGTTFTDTDYDVWGAGVAYTFGKNTIKGQYYSADEDGVADDASMFAVGYDYALSKQTTLYAAYAAGMDGATPWKAAHGVTTDGSATEDNTAISVGVKHKF